MGNRPYLEDKPDEWFLETIGSAKNLSEHARNAASYRGGWVDRNSLRRQMERRGILLKARKIYQDNVPPPVAPEFESKPLPPDVTTKEGRKEHGKDSLIKELRKENKKLKEHLVEQEEAHDRLAELVEIPREKPKFKVKLSAGKKSRDVVLHLSDLHYGEYVRAEDTPGGLNEFNVEVFTRRLERYVNAVSRSMDDFAAGHTLEHLIFALGGDMVTGDNIFPNQAWALDRHPIEQVLELCDLLTEAMTRIMQIAHERLGMHQTHIFCVPGNHGGMASSKRTGGHPKTYNWDWLLYKMMLRTLPQDTVGCFEIEPAGSLYFGSKDHVFQLSHGQAIKGALSIPFYGVGRFDQRSIRSHRIVPDALLLGHFHVRGEIPLGYGESFHNGSFLGPNNLAEFTGASPASQNMFLVSEEHGPAQRSTIHLQDRTERQIRPEIFATEVK